ncbi:MAG: ribonuclease PH [Oligoflexales bacterium]
MRKNGRSSIEMRPIRITPHYTSNPTGSVLIETGDTRVLCTTSVDDGVPGWMRSQRHSRGWLTAEYSMLPGSSPERVRRERSHTSGRTQEIQRLIGRSLRGVVDLSLCPDKTFMIDCDVLQADAGTRTAAITGAWISLKLAVDKLMKAGRLQHNPIKNQVAAVGVALKNGELRVDPDYTEDSEADLDMNIVMCPGMALMEIQGTGEGAVFNKEQVSQIIDAAGGALEPIYELQQLAADGECVES